MDYCIAIICLLVGGALMWRASRNLSPEDQAKIDVPVQRAKFWRWVWLAVILAYPFLSNLTRAEVLCFAVFVMAVIALRHWLRLSRFGLPQSYLRIRFLGGVVCFTGAALVCWDLVKEAMVHKA
jgi:hypothetical protein